MYAFKPRKSLSSGPKFAKFYTTSLPSNLLKSKLRYSTPL